MADAQGKADAQGMAATRLSGRPNYHAGRAAEGAVEADYRGRGRPIVDRRWRGGGGEIDLVAADGDGLIFVEVKKSRTHDSALARVTRRQADRICRAAAAYLEGSPRGQLTPARFDVATVDARGEVRILENAFGL